jgi:four helix bundle protein
VIRDHRKLDAFVLADEMAVRVYQATRDFPASELYGLRSQLRRAAVSVATNIVEGCSRESDRDFCRFLEVAFGSAREVLYLIDLSRRLGLIEPGRADELTRFGGRSAAALFAFRKSVKAQLSK